MLRAYLIQLRQSCFLKTPDEAAKVYYAGNSGITVETANLWAANEVPAQVVQCIDAGENVAVETVLSSDKYEPIIRHAHSKGYQVGMSASALPGAGEGEGFQGPRGNA